MEKYIRFKNPVPANEHSNWLVYGIILKDGARWNYKDTESIDAKLKKLIHTFRTNPAWAPWSERIPGKITYKDLVNIPDGIFFDHDLCRDTIKHPAQMSVVNADTILE